MSTQQTAITKFIEANGIRFAYRLFGKEEGIPLVMLIHFRGNMDFWDPILINALAKTRTILLLDYPGIGKSSGEFPLTIDGWADSALTLLHALKITRIDLLGFSMGGAVAQQVTLAAPKRMVRKLVLAGTRTSGSPNTVAGPREVFEALSQSETQDEFAESWALSFFDNTVQGRLAAKASWERILSRSQDRAPHANVETAKRQITAFWDFSERKADGAFARIKEIGIPVLVANGDNDTLVPTENSFELQRILPNAQLHVYPNSGHGFLFQYGELFAKHVEVFLDDGVESQAKTAEISSKI
jgi:pimeloyl-ACP methyl ester carboxylesterase